MKYHSFLSRRFLTSRFIPFAAVIAVAFGVFCLIPVLSVMEGFKTEMRKHIRGSLSHLTIESPTYLGLTDEYGVKQSLEGMTHVAAVAPYVEAMALYKSSSLATCWIKGVDPSSEANVNEFESYLLRDTEIDFLRRNPTERLSEDRQPMSTAEMEELFTLERREWAEDRAMLNGRPDEREGFDQGLPPQPVLVGIEALRRGFVGIGTHLDLTTYSPRFRVRADTFIVVGAFQTGVFEQDMQWIYMPLSVAQNFLELYDEELGDLRYSGFSVRLDDYRHADSVRDEIERDGLSIFAPEELRVRTWEDQRKTLLQAVDVEKKIISVMMLLIVAFAGVVIFLILTVMVIEKTRDLGVLRSLGATSSGVVLLFLRTGMTLCVIGTLLGALGGWFFTAYINEIHDMIYQMTRWRLFPPDIYYLTEIPVAHRAADWVLIIGSSFFFGLLASIVPAAWAASRDPVKALRYE